MFRWNSGDRHDAGEEVVTRTAQDARSVGRARAVPASGTQGSAARVTRGETVFTAFAQLLAIVPSRVGMMLRGAYYYGTLKRSLWETHIGFGPAQVVICCCVIWPAAHSSRQPLIRS